VKELGCSEIWGGVRDQEVDLCSRALVTSLWSHAAGGGRGGDVYYLSVCGADSLTRLALVDVVGHGRAVTDVAQSLYEALRARLDDSAGETVLADLNRSAAARGIRSLASAMVVGLVRDSRTLRSVSAGHPPVLLRRREDERWVPVVPASLQAPAGAAPPTDLPLGVVRDARYSPVERKLDPGDRLFLYTDGVLEAPGAGGERFGLDRLRAVLDELGDAEPAELKGGVREALLGFTGGSLAHDDVTLIAAQVR